MVNLYDGYTLVDEKECAFAGANTASGFVSAYDTIAREGALERVYSIKGGAGTGKSTFMRRCAEATEAMGRPVRRYLCGSDARSLDCVVLDDRIAVLDGTAPHVREMRYPGAASAIVDVSRFWDTAALERERDAIVSLSDQKQAAYASAYRYLAATDLLARERAETTRSMFLADKAASSIGRLLKTWGKPRGQGGVTPIRTHALTMHGACRTAWLTERAETVYTVTDVVGCAAPYMDLLTDALVRAGYTVTVSRLPSPDCIVGIYVADCRVAVTVGGDGDRTINMARFASGKWTPGTRGAYRLAGKIALSCRDEAISALSRAADAHFDLEQIYQGAMDFDALQAYSESIIDEITMRLARPRK